MAVGEGARSVTWPSRGFCVAILQLIGFYPYSRGMILAPEVWAKTGICEWMEGIHTFFRRQMCKMSGEADRSCSEVAGMISDGRDALPLQARPAMLGVGLIWGVSMRQGRHGALVSV